MQLYQLPSDIWDHISSYLLIDSITTILSTSTRMYMRKVYITHFIDRKGSGTNFRKSFMENGLVPILELFPNLSSINVSYRLIVPASEILIFLKSLPPTMKSLTMKYVSLEPRLDARLEEKTNADMVSINDYFANSTLEFIDIDFPIVEYPRNIKSASIRYHEGIHLAETLTNLNLLSYVYDENMVLPPDLTRLTLRCRHSVDSRLPEMPHGLQFLEISYYGTHLDISALKSCKNLRTLRFTEAGFILNSGNSSFLPPNLEYLKCTFAAGEGVTILSRLPQRIPHIKEFSPDATTFLNNESFRIITDFKDLQVLSIFNNKMLTDSFIYIVPRSLKRLTLGYCENLTTNICAGLPSTLEHFGTNIVVDDTVFGILPQTLSSLILTSCKNRSTKISGAQNLPPNLFTLTLFYSKRVKLSTDYIYNLPRYIRNLNLKMIEDRPSKVSRGTLFKYLPPYLSKFVYSYSGVIEQSPDDVKVLPKSITILDLGGYEDSDEIITLRKRIHRYLPNLIEFNHTGVDLCGDEFEPLPYRNYNNIEMIREHVPLDQ